MSISDVEREAAIIVAIVERIDFAIRMLLVPYDIYMYICNNYYREMTRKIYCKYIKNYNVIELVYHNNDNVYFNSVEELQVFADRLEKLKVII